MKTVSRATLIAMCIGTFVLLANMWHVLYAWIHTPKNTVFTGIAHYFADYFLYTSYIAQGTRGAWIWTQHLYTNEPLAPTWIYWFYTLLGHLGSNPFLLYNISLIVLSAILLYTWWYVLDKKILTFLFVITASNIPGVGDFWFSPTPALNRLGGVPHQILQTILLLLCIVFFTQRKHILFMIVSFLASISTPIHMGLLAISILYKNPKKILLFVPSLAGALITNYAFSHDQILTAAKIWEQSQSISVSLLTFLLALGPIMLLVPFGIKIFIKEKNETETIILFYGLLSLACFFTPIPTLLSTSSIRWISPLTVALFPLIAARGVRYPRITIVLYLLVTIPSFVSQIQARQQSPESLLYIPLHVVQNIQQLEGNNVVLTNPNLPYDIIIPVFAGRKSFTGHPIHTLYPNVKEDLRNKFFDGSMNEPQKQQFLNDHTIDSVFHIP